MKFPKNIWILIVDYYYFPEMFSSENWNRYIFTKYFGEYDLYEEMNKLVDNNPLMQFLLNEYNIDVRDSYRVNKLSENPKQRYISLGEFDAEYKRVEVNYTPTENAIGLFTNKIISEKTLFFSHFSDEHRDIIIDKHYFSDSVSFISLDRCIRNVADINFPKDLYYLSIPSVLGVVFPNNLKILKIHTISDKTNTNFNPPDNLEILIINIFLTPIGELPITLKSIFAIKCSFDARIDCIHRGINMCCREEIKEL